MSYEYQQSDSVERVARQLIECDKYRTVMGDINPDRIAYIHASGKKTPKGWPVPAQVKALNPLMRAVANDSVVFVLIVFDTWFKWEEEKQFAAILEQLLLIDTDGEDGFEGGKLRKYDTLGLSYMIENFGLNWQDRAGIPHPVEDGPGQVSGLTTFQGDEGYVEVQEEQAVQEVVTPEDVDNIENQLNDIEEGTFN